MKQCDVITEQSGIAGSGPRLLGPLDMCERLGKERLGISQSPLFVSAVTGFGNGHVSC